jgi:hypothetical protein
MSQIMHSHTNKFKLFIHGKEELQVYVNMFVYEMGDKTNCNNFREISLTKYDLIICHSSHKL